VIIKVLIESVGEIFLEEGPGTLEQEGYAHIWSFTGCNISFEFYDKTQFVEMDPNSKTHCS
jgi:hypothetical protein